MEVTDEEFEELRQQAMLEWRIENDPAYAHLASEDTTQHEVEEEVEVVTQSPVSEDHWQMTGHEQRTLLEYGTLAEWAQDLLRESLLNDNPSATAGVYENAGMVQNDIGVWDYPEDHVYEPQEGPEAEQEIEPEEELSPEDLEKLIQEELRKHREKTGRY